MSDPSTRWGRGSGLEIHNRDVISTAFLRRSIVGLHDAAFHFHEHLLRWLVERVGLNGESQLLLARVRLLHLIEDPGDVVPGLGFGHRAIVR